MASQAFPASTTDPTPIFELFRGSYGSELLTAATGELDVFGRLARSGPRTPGDLAAEIGIGRRPAAVLFTALRAMGLLEIDPTGLLRNSAIADAHLVPGATFDVGGYLGLAAEAPGVRAMVERLRNDRPVAASADDAGAAFIYREGLDSAMEAERSARRLTLALAGRARVVAPSLASAVAMDGSKRLLDVGGGSGLYSVGFLAANPGLKAVVWDRPEVLKVAVEMAERHGVADRLECVAGDMFADPVPAGCDAVLLSNILHDWDEPECATLVGRLAGALPAGGRLLVNDVFLDDDLGGPLPIALYSAALFTLTEGRAYSAAEYRSWLGAAGLIAGPVVPTAVHCGVIEARKPS